MLSLSSASNVRSDCSTARVKGRCHLRSADCANPTPKTAFPRCTFCSAVCRNLLVSRLTLCRSGHWVEAENIIAHWDEGVALALPARLIRSSAGRSYGGFARSYRGCRCGGATGGGVQHPHGDRPHGARAPGSPGLAFGDPAICRQEAATASGRPLRVGKSTKKVVPSPSAVSKRISPRC